MTAKEATLVQAEDIHLASASDVKKAQGKLVTTFIVCFLGTFFSGVITMLMSVYLPVTVKDLLGQVSDDRMNDVSAWINCVFIFGWMFGGILWGFISDRIGRSKSVTLSIGCFGLFAIATGLSSSWVMVCLCRFFTGFGIGGLLVSSTVLVSELWSSKSKAIVLGIVSVAMPVGFFAAGVINNLTENWRTAFWCGGIPFIVAAVAWFWLPESEQWSTRNVERSRIINRELFSSDYTKNLLIGSVVFGTMLIGLWAIFSWAPTWAQSISTASEAQQQRGSTMMILAGGGIAGSFLSGWIVNSIGLRKTMLMCFAVCFVMAFVVFKLNTTISFVTYVELVVMAFFFGISQGALAVYIPSLFPVSICASATGFCFNIGRLFTGTVVFFIGALVSLLGGYGNAVFVFSFIFVVGFIATWINRQENNTKSVFTS